jgi:hypothetical protein
VSAPARPSTVHRAVKAGHPQRSHYICAECLVLWPCVEAHRAVTRCKVCDRLWSEHTDAEYRLGCKAVPSRDSEQRSEQRA